jgi:hypothetical protein
VKSAPADGLGASGGVPIALLPYRTFLEARPQGAGNITARKVLKGIGALLASKRGARTYAYVLFNGIVHSGTFTWLGLYFARRYGLSEVGLAMGLNVIPLFHTEAIAS